MITTTIGELLNDQGPGDRNTCLYVVRDGETVFYVGRSQRGTIERIKQHCGMGLRYTATDELGQLILANSPYSGAWQVELYELEDCAAFVHAADPGRTRYSLDFAEAAAIQALRPCLNGTYNDEASALPERYRHGESARRQATRILDVPYTRRGK